MTPSLFVTVPCMRGVLSVPTASTLISLADRCRGAGVPCEIKFFASPAPHAQQRNHQAMLFLESNASHHLQLDDDVGVNAAGIFAMLDANKPIIGCACPLRLDAEAPSFNVKALGGAATRTDYAPGLAPARVDAIGTGCMLVARVVYETLARSTPKYAYRYEDGPRVAHEFYKFEPVDIGEGGPPFMLGEDYNFCRHAAAAGFATWVIRDSRALCHHMGIYTWRGADMLEPACDEAKEAAE